MDTFQELIGQWPTKSELAKDCGVEYGVAHQWDRRNSIPAEYWSNVVSSAKRRGIQGVSLKVLQTLRKNKKYFQ